jgi:ElaB/YqjD/DUF883 family membrane-anchored ribosome-binding protein
MADGNDASSSMISHGEAAERVHSTANTGRGAARDVVSEFVDAARSAAESLLEEQRQQTAERASSIAEALRSAAKSLDHSQNRAIARYADQAADQIEHVSRAMRERPWNEIVADTEEFARRQPTLFVLAAVATGFLAGRLLWTPSGGLPQESDPTRQGTNLGQSPSETVAVTAAVSSGSGSGEKAGYGAETSGAMKAQ